MELTAGPQQNAVHPAFASLYPSFQSAKKLANFLANTKMPMVPTYTFSQISNFSSAFPFQCAMWSVSCCPRNCHGHPGILGQGAQGVLIRLTGLGSLHGAELAWGFPGALLRLGHNPLPCSNLPLFPYAFKVRRTTSQTSIITANITLI